MAFRARKVFRTLEKLSPGIKLKSALQRKEDKIENLWSSAHVVRTTAKQVISLRRQKDYEICEIYKN